MLPLIPPSPPGPGLYGTGPGILPLSRPSPPDGGLYGTGRVIGRRRGGISGGGWRVLRVVSRAARRWVIARAARRWVIAGAARGRVVRRTPGLGVGGRGAL